VIRSEVIGEVRIRVIVEFGARIRAAPAS
jgi:hypothetical protein